MKNTLNKEEMYWLVLIIVLIIYFLTTYFIFFNHSSQEIVPITPIIEKFEIQKNYSYNEVIDSGNVSLCNNLIETDLIEVCKIKLVQCNTDDCYFEQARFNSDETLCFNISDENLKAGCTLDIKRNQLLENALLSNNLKLCDSFEDQANINHCRDNYYIAKRFNEDNPSYCQFILNEVIKNECNQ